MEDVPLSKEYNNFMQGNICKDDVILKIHKPWIDLILSGEKKWEIRSKPCLKHVGKTIFLGYRGEIFGKVLFDSIIKIESDEFWTENFQKHKVNTTTKPYKNTYAYVFKNPETFYESIKYVPKKGCVIWEYY